MRRIKQLVDHIDEELCGAKDYAEEYLDRKARNDQWAGKFRDMANDELGHAMNLHQLAVEEIGKLSTVYTPPVNMQEEWDHAHKSYIERAAWIKQMLNM